MRRVRVASWVLAIALAISTGVMVAFAGWSTQPGIDLEVVFDGGYIYETGGNQRLEVKTLRKGMHPMRLRIDVGTPESAISEFRLNGGTLELWPNGTAPAAQMPKLPPRDESQHGCDAARDQQSPNNRYFLPNLKEAADGMGTRLRRKPEAAGTIILTGGGELAIRAVSGCVEYRLPNGTAVGRPRSMASGVEGVVYRWDISTANTLTLRITSAAGDTLSIPVAPVNRKVRLHVGSFDPPPMINNNPHRIAHFESFDDAFESIPAGKRVSLWWVKGYGPLRLLSPGIDCPSGEVQQP